MPTRRLALLLVTLALPAACAGTESPPSPPRQTATTLAAGAADPRAFPVFTEPDQPIVVAVGARFGILLPAEHTAGFRWQLTADPDRAVLMPLGNELLTSTTALPGSPDAEVISFAARAEGQTTIRLRYVGSDGSPDPTGRTATFTVTVTATGEPPLPAETSPTTHARR